MNFKCFLEIHDIFTKILYSCSYKNFEYILNSINSRYFFRGLLYKSSARNSRENFVLKFRRSTSRAPNQPCWLYTIFKNIQTNSSIFATHIIGKRRVVKYKIAIIKNNSSNKSETILLIYKWEKGISQSSFFIVLIKTP